LILVSLVSRTISARRLESAISGSGINCVFASRT
jgi:hypothetical protein